MNVNVKAFLRGAVLDWLLANSSMPRPLSPGENEAFFIIPVSTDHPEYKEITKSLIKRFNAAKKITTKPADDFLFRLIDEDTHHLILACRIDGQPISSNLEFNSDLEEGDASFLQRIHLITNEQVPAPKEIPGRLISEAINTNSPIFEADLDPYLPKITSWRAPKGSVYYRDTFEVACTRLLLELVDSKAPARKHSASLVQLALVIPPKDHDWLFSQLYFTIASRKPEHLFLGLYKLLEFFFPLKGVSALKRVLQFNGSFLELRDYCSNALGWNVNHNTGARAAASFCTEAFADICLGKTLPSDADAGAIERHKIDAISKISDLRHVLTHQSFTEQEPDEIGLTQKTNSLLTLLIDAFGAYKENHLTGLHEGHPSAAPVKSQTRAPAP